MRKISSRDFQKRFAEITNTMKSGQVVEITRHGKTIGRFTRTSGSKIKMPDFMAQLEKHTYPPAIGNQLLKEFYDSFGKQ